MPYTRKDAEREVGTSTDWAIGLATSIKKWEQIVEGDVDSYDRDEFCGLCFVAANRGVVCHGCPSIPACRLLFDEHSDKEILKALKKLWKEI